MAMGPEMGETGLVWAYISGQHQSKWEMQVHERTQGWGMEKLEGEETLGGGLLFRGQA